MNENNQRDESKLHFTLVQNILDHIFWRPYWIFKMAATPVSFNIYQDISHNQKHRFRHKVCDCV